MVYQTKARWYSSPDKGRLGGVSIRDVGFIPYRQDLKEYARHNRKNPTPAEQKLWSILRKRLLSRYKFTRQKPLENFIVDFYCPQLLLVIEVDGDSHSRQVEYDQLRSDVLKEKYKVKVVRYTNEEVLHNLEGVYQDLVQVIHLREKTLPSPPLSGREHHSVSESSK